MYRVALMLILMPIAPVAAQVGSPSPPRPKARIVEYGERKPIVGVVESSDSQSLLVRTAAADEVVPRSRIARLDISRGERSNASRGLAHGALIGGAVGAVLGFVVFAARDQINCFCDLGPEMIPIGAISGTFVGGGIGLIVGSLSHSEQWERRDPATEFPGKDVAFHAARKGLGLAIGF